MPEETKTRLECEEIFALLSEYLDREVSPDVADCISAHVVGCGPCVEFIESLRRSVEVCRRFQAEVIPSPLAQDVRKQIRESYERMIQLRKGAAAT